MSHTEAEALKLWCPMARVISADFSTSSNRWSPEDSPQADCLCIASECAMWRWSADSAFFDAELGMMIKDVAPIARGFCGLAGRPL